MVTVPTSSCQAMLKIVKAMALKPNVTLLKNGTLFKELLFAVCSLNCMLLILLIFKLTAVYQVISPVPTISSVLTLATL